MNDKELLDLFRRAQFARTSLKARYASLEAAREAYDTARKVAEAAYDDLRTYAKAGDACYALEQELWKAMGE
ncbi:MAG: hypothetical protein ACXVGN_00160 [Mycobacteriaceae bacterium]